MNKKGMHTHFLKHYPLSFLNTIVNMQRRRRLDKRHKKTCNVLILQVLQ